MDKDKDEDTPVPGPLSKKEDPPPVPLEVKTLDSKNPQAKIVRGTKKMRIDSTDSTQTQEKKGLNDLIYRFIVLVINCKYINFIFFI